MHSRFQTSVVFLTNVSYSLCRRRSGSTPYARINSCAEVFTTYCKFHGFWNISCYDPDIFGFKALLCLINFDLFALLSARYVCSKGNCFLGPCFVILKVGLLTSFLCFISDIQCRRVNKLDIMLFVTTLFKHTFQDVAWSCISIIHELWLLSGKPWSRRRENTWTAKKRESKTIATVSVSDNKLRPRAVDEVDTSMLDVS